MKKEVELSQSEFNVAYPYAFGELVKQVAHRNGISRAAANSRLKDVYSKLGIHDRIELHQWFLAQDI